MEPRFLIAAVAVIYFGIAISYAWRSKWPQALVWICYSLANIGMLLMDGESK